MRFLNSGPIENHPAFDRILAAVPIGEEAAARPAQVAKTAQASPGSMGDTLINMHNAGYIRQKIKTIDYKSVNVYWRDGDATIKQYAG